MNKEVLVAKNITREGPGLIESVLKERGVGFSVVDLSASETIPPADTFEILVVMGGPDSANDNTAKMQAELQMIKESIDAGKPYLGICLGLQTLVKAAGGRVIKSPVREIGFRDLQGQLFTVDLTDAGKADPLFKGLSRSFHVFHLHGETVEITDRMHLLARGRDVKNQVVRVGENAYGIQSHFELTPQMLETWLQEDPDLQQADREKIRGDFKKLQAEYTKTGTQLFNNFLDIAQSK